MKKKFLALAFAAATIFGLSANAQTTSTNNTQACSETTCVTSAKDGAQARQGCPDGKKDKKGGDRKGQRNGQCDSIARCCKANPFEGITLTSTQQQQLQDLQAKRAATRAEKKAQAKSQKQNRDSAARADRKAETLVYLQEVKKIVGPENYVTVLENMVVQSAPQGGKGKAPKMKAANFKKTNLKKGNATQTKAQRGSKSAKNAAATATASSNS